MRPRVVSDIIDECRTRGILVEYVDDMTELGKAFCIDVGASVVALTGLQIQDPHL
jgi:ribosomal protein L7Ae-like RNA K-turn-binding protein